MIISNKYKYIICNIPKTGTISLNETLNSFGVCDISRENKWQGLSYKSKRNLDHMTFKEVEDLFKINYDNVPNSDKKILKYPFEEYLKFIIVRNPWDRYISLLDRIKRSQLDDLLQLQNISSTRFYDLNLDFKSSEPGDIIDQLEYVILQNKKQSSYYMDNFGGNYCKYIYGLESIQMLVDRLQEECKIKIKIKLSHLNKHEKLIDYTKYYTQYLIDLVKLKESDVIDLMGYKFNGDFYKLSDSRASGVNDFNDPSNSWYDSNSAISNYKNENNG